MRKMNRRSGMTLAEMLLTAAILGILAAVSAISIVTVRRNSEQLRLDSVAETIYEAATNQMKELYAFRHGAVDGLVRKEYYAKLSAQNNAIHFAELGDADTGTDFDVVLPSGSISSEWRGANAKIVVEYLPASAAVYAVFFADDAGLSYADIYGDSSVAGSIRGDRDNRIRFAREHGGRQVGYYSGFADGALPQSANLPNPDDDMIVSLGTLTVGGRRLSNGDELVARAAVKLPKLYTDDARIDQHTPSRELIESQSPEKN